MPREWTVKDYWDWNPAFTAGLAQFQREKELAAREKDADKDRELRRDEIAARLMSEGASLGMRQEDLALRRQSEERLSAMQERTQTRLEKADLDKLAEQLGEARGYQNAPATPNDLANPAFLSGYQRGRQLLTKDTRDQQQAMDRIREAAELRETLTRIREEMRASRQNAPAPMATEVPMEGGGNVPGVVWIGGRPMAVDPLSAVIQNALQGTNAPRAVPPPGGQAPPPRIRYDKSGKRIP